MCRFVTQTQAQKTALSAEESMGPRPNLDPGVTVTTAAVDYFGGEAGLIAWEYDVSLITLIHVRIYI